MHSLLRLSRLSVLLPVDPLYSEQWLRDLWHHLHVHATLWDVFFLWCATCFCATSSTRRQATHMGWPPRHTWSFDCWCPLLNDLVVCRFLIASFRNILPDCQITLSDNGTYYPLTTSAWERGNPTHTVLVVAPRWDFLFLRVLLVWFIFRASEMRESNFHAAPLSAVLWSPSTTLLIYVRGRDHWIVSLHLL